MRIAVAKPDHGVVGGCEKVLMRIERGLTERGHELRRLSVDVASVPPVPFGVTPPPQVWRQHPEFFRYMSLVDAFDRLDASGADLLISTQPPSFAARHPRHLSLFFHHQRLFYDLSGVFARSGHIDPALQARAAELVRRVDAPRLGLVDLFLCNSEVTRERLLVFNGFRDTTDVYHAGIGIPAGSAASTGGAGDTVLCVGRVSFTKRTELFVQAMRMVGNLRGLVAGDGDRLPFVRALDARLASLDGDVDSLTDEDLWLNRGEVTPAQPPRDGSRVELLGSVGDAELAQLYSRCLCVVAPALDEDYGMTAIEAMTFARPVIVCRDGGGLALLVEDGVTGLVVEPTGRAIAEAVRRLDEDRDLAREMGERGREVAAGVTWERAIDKVAEAVERVMDAPAR